MAQNKLDSQVYNSNGLCEAVNCYEPASTQITVKVGQKGTITLDLCCNCISKFVTCNDDQETITSGNNNTSRLEDALEVGGML
jgi:hypothetical protein